MAPPAAHGKPPAYRRRSMPPRAEIRSFLRPAIGRSVRLIRVQLLSISKLIWWAQGLAIPLMSGDMSITGAERTFAQPHPRPLPVCTGLERVINMRRRHTLPDRSCSGLIPEGYPRHAVILLWRIYSLMARS